jgi:hypothetical protein
MKSLAGSEGTKLDSISLGSNDVSSAGFHSDRGRVLSLQMVLALEDTGWDIPSLDWLCPIWHGLWNLL